MLVKFWNNVKFSLEREGGERHASKAAWQKEEALASVLQMDGPMSVKR